MPFETNDYSQKNLSLDELLIKNRPATFLMRISGQDMPAEGIFEGDYILIDRSANPHKGSLVVAIKDGEHVLTKWSAHLNKKEEIVELFGIVSAVIRRF